MASFFMYFLITLLVSFQPSEAKNATDASTDQLQTYIVQLRAPNHLAHLLNDKQKRESWYASLLSQTVSDPHHRLVHSYHHVFPGFAATLTPDEFEALQHLEGIVSAWPDEMYYPHTTHSPQFLGLNKSVGGFWDKSEYGSGIIIGVLDSGINADGHVSFKGDGSPPEEWNGKCEAPIKCNNKLIGAKSLVGGSPKDETGHGSHVAGIAAGYMVAGANVNGEGSGVASGVGPNSQLAVYKVCTAKGCSGAAILAGFDAAIEDGVHVISVSLGQRGHAGPLAGDNIAIGAFSAMKKGIFVSISAGNSGSSRGTVSNEAPWYLTVGSSTTDRDINLGDGIQSILDRYSGDGMGSLLGETTYGNLNAPRVAYSSSRGPTRVAEGIIKPDIIGPGVQIIAASHKGVNKFAIMSGTSMACPHLSGAAGLIKKLHPDWSPAVIKSALMTTAYQKNLGKGPISGGIFPATPYDMGAGHVDVVKANDPGLVFDVQPDDYIPYLCSLRLSSKQVSTIVSDNVDCAKVGKLSGSSLNLPSIYMDFYLKGGSKIVARTFTNVGSSASEVYKVKIEYGSPGKFVISVDPKELQFSDLNEKKTCQITFTRKAELVRWNDRFAASIVWRSDKHAVRIPIEVYM